MRRLGTSRRGLGRPGGREPWQIQLLGWVLSAVLALLLTVGLVLIDAIGDQRFERLQASVHHTLTRDVEFWSWAPVILILGLIYLPQLFGWKPLFERNDVLPNLPRGRWWAILAYMATATLCLTAGALTLGRAGYYVNDQGVGWARGGVMVAEHRWSEAVSASLRCETQKRDYEPYRVPVLSLTIRFPDKRKVETSVAADDETVMDWIDTRGAALDAVRVGRQTRPATELKFYRGDGCRALLAQHAPVEMREAIDRLYRP